MIDMYENEWKVHKYDDRNQKNRQRKRQEFNNNTRNRETETKTKKEWEIAAENENRIHRIKLFGNLIAHASFDLIRFLVGIIMLLLLLLCSRLCIMLGCSVSACNSL